MHLGHYVKRKQHFSPKSPLETDVSTTEGVKVMWIEVQNFQIGLAESGNKISEKEIKAR